MTTKKQNAKLVVASAELVAEVKPVTPVVAEEVVRPADCVVSPAEAAHAHELITTVHPLSSKYAAKQKAQAVKDDLQSLQGMLEEAKSEILASFPDEIYSLKEFDVELKGLEAEEDARDEGKRKKAARRLVLQDIEDVKRKLQDARNALNLHQRRIAIFRQTAREALMKVPQIQTIHANLDALTPERKAEFLARIEAAIHASTLKLHGDDLSGEMNAKFDIDEYTRIVVKLVADSNELDQEAEDAFTFAAEIRAQAGLAPRVRGKGGDEN